jgi:hypothetical protein
MIQFLFKLILCVLLAIAAAFAYVAVKSGDPMYAFYEWMSPARFHQYDRLIRSVALEHHLDPMLVKAVVWRESRFDPKKRGTHGERGLMQVSEVAANEWARENKIAGFNPDQLFEPRRIWRRAPGICIAPWNTGATSPIQLLLLWRSTTPAPAVPSVGAVEKALPRYRNGSFFKRSISPQRVDTSSRLSIATNSISGVGGCDKKQRADDQSTCVSRFRLVQ